MAEIVPPLQNENRPSVKEVMEFIGTTVRVTISDGRKLTGRFECVDWDQNVILNYATEAFTDVSSSELKNERTVGSIMIPGKEIVKFEMFCCVTFNASWRLLPAGDLKLAKNTIFFLTISKVQ